MSGIAITRLGLSASELRAGSAKAPDARSARRMLALALVVEGIDRETAAATRGMSRQTLCDWVHRYNEEGLAGLTNRLSAGPPRRLSGENLAELVAIVEQGPDPAVDGVVRWRCVDLKRVIAERFGVAMHERTVGKQLAALGLVRLSVRPRHPEANEATQEAFKKNFADAAHAAIPEAGRSKPIEIWFQDEARVGQQGTLERDPLKLQCILRH